MNLKSKRFMSFESGFSISPKWWSFFRACSGKRLGFACLAESFLPRIRWRASVAPTSLGHFFCQLSMVPLKRNLIGRICDLLRHVSIPRTNFFLR
ncbi:hypothetical protein D917_08901 [Trichinella nativa]|uniref:Uncharacterized protein n=1 Tax=Trichinella nativa TaxID=6335 RepID=A0A1Y3EHN5_9BILA|nr:hypothetical protein D917_08901 [Trichinella nativa]